MTVTALALTSCGGASRSETPWIVDRFDDIKVIRYEVPGFEQLPLEEKELIYYLAEATKCGRDILFDQNFKYNLAVRRTLETVYENYEGDRTTAEWKALEKYLKKVWFANGIHHHYSNDKFVPEFTEGYLLDVIETIPEEKFGELNPLRGEVCKAIFDASLYKTRLNQTAGEDLIATSSNNYYEGVTQAEVEKFYADMADPHDPEPISYGLNSKLVREDGGVRERVWKIGGMYSPAIEKIVYWLEKAQAVAKEPQKTNIAALVSYYKTGDLKEFDRYNIGWVKDTVSNVDFVNGFIEDYGDPLGRKASWEGIVDFMDKEACHRTEVISENAQWFEDHSPVDPAFRKAKVKGEDIKAIGISYQMHGLVVVDKKMEVLRPSIIWCDSRAVPYGERAFKNIGEKRCLSHLLNSPGNFTASKLAWIKEYEPDIYDRIHKIMLPGDFIAMRLTGDIVTTVSGLSEGIFWDFKNNALSEDLMNYYGFSKDLIADIRPTFGLQGEVTASVAAELGLKKGTPVTYRAGDQPNNALSLNVLNPGEIAATGGASGVVYGVNGKVNYDTLSRVNTFAHVNHTTEQTRLGVLLCINGVGILNSWIKRNIAPEGINYNELNDLAATVPIGCDGLSILPFGNGAERMLQNKQIDCSVHGLNFNIHTKAHMARAAQEGIVFAFKYGMDIMNEMGIDIQVIRAGNANLFLSPIFRDALAGVTGTVIELYDTNGAVGAAKGAGIGAGIYKNAEEAFASLKKINVIEPDGFKANAYCGAFETWKERLEQSI